ncbi:type II CAAX endopeptidase family protein [Actinoplanes sichuanensis]|uniref:CPBP family intramembrane glutamic endopeptidase n=1 Tax=Actinoplanes sichuanensis TaxID=512349 RepID=A0ABW4A0R9_9ACTN|nr:CPBP family intramembrane glutamic endopeptidase [Actinoplanes sichuanensis]BEL04183.1 type II CAAX endopeptidase family protein [Actinoplanes sichuanensis]
MWFLVQLVAVVAVSLLAGQAVALVDGRAWPSLVVGVGAAVVSTLVYSAVVRATEKRRVVETSGRTAASGLIRGLILGVAVFSLVIGVIALNGGYRIVGTTADPINAVGLAGFMAAAVTSEELLYRGVLFRHLERVTGTWLAFAVSALVFGGVHLLNPNATWWGALCVAIAGGGMLTSAFIAARNLWLPIGLHFGWNYAQSAIFGSEVSGNGVREGILESESSGDALISGGLFGPEASVFTLVAGVVVTVVFLWLAHRRGRLVPIRRAAAVEADAQPSKLAG